MDYGSQKLDIDRNSENVKNSWKTLKIRRHNPKINFKMLVARKLLCVDTPNRFFRDGVVTSFQRWATVYKTRMSIENSGNDEEFVKKKIH